MALMEKKRTGGTARKRTLRKRRRMGLYIIVGLVILAIGWLGFVGMSNAVESGRGTVKQVEPPVITEPPAVVSEEPAAEARAEEEAAQEEAAREQAAAEARAAEKKRAAEERAEAAAAPEDPTMYMTVPALGIYDIPVINEDSEAALTAGASHMTSTGFPWQSGSNTYISGHRLGYPGTPSDHVFYNLPNLGTGAEVILTDTNGKTYTYKVTEFLEVSPTDTWVADSIPNRDVVSLQTCTENFGDYWTEGPNWFARYIVRADRVS